MPSMVVASNAHGGQELSGTQFEDLRKWLGEVLAVERHVISLELERRHRRVLADYAQRWSASAQGAGLEIDIPSATDMDLDQASEEKDGKTQLFAPSFEGCEDSGNDNSGQISPSPGLSEQQQESRRTSGSSKRGSVFDEAPPKVYDRWTHRLVESHKFELTFIILVVANTIVMAAESQYDGLGLGNVLEYPNFSDAKRDIWPGAKEAFLVLDWFFGIVFTFEIIIKIFGFRLDFVRDPWNWFDSVIVLSWLIDALFRDLVSLPIDPMLLRLARLARLLRLVKLIKKLQGVDQLFLMMTTLKGSIMVLIWTILFLFTCQTMFALFCNQLIVTYYLEDSGQDLKQRQDTFKYFGTFARSMLSMFEITLGNWVPVARNLYENVTPWFIFFSVLHKLSMGFAVLGVINGIFIQETFKVASCDDTIMLLQKERQIRVHGKKMQAFFLQADESGDGSLDRNEFQAILRNPKIKTWLAAQELDTGDADSLFTLLGGDDKHDKLTALDLVRGVSKLKGTARSIDMAMLIRDVKKTQDEVKKLLDYISGAGSGEKAFPTKQATQDLEYPIHDCWKKQCSTIGTNQEPAWQDIARPLFEDSPVDAEKETQENSNEIFQPQGDSFHLTPTSRSALSANDENRKVWRC